MNKQARFLATLVGWLLAAVVHAGTVTYIHTDAQGTPVMESDAQGHITKRFEYTPYGVVVTSMGAAPNGPGYTGHVNDPETGLVYMQARYYDPMGRMLSVDPVGPTPGNIYSFNRYAYVNNNPIMHVDPTGMACGGNGEVSAKVQAMRDTSDGCAGSASEHADANSPSGHQAGGQQIARMSSSRTDMVNGNSFGTANDGVAAVPVAYQGHYHDELVQKLASGMSSAGANVLTEVTMCLEVACARIDILGRSPIGDLFALEVKTGVRPNFTPQQVAVYPHMRKGNLLISPDQKIRQLGLLPGLPLPSINGALLYQRDVSSQPFVVPIP